MDVRISLGVLLALAMSVYETVTHAEHAYFDSAAMLLAFLLLGRFLDHAMRRKTRAVAANLAALRAPLVPVARLEPGDLVLARPGERIPVDGVIASGASMLDESVITGETRPRAVGSGDQVCAGALNYDGALRVTVRSKSGATLLDDIERLLEKGAEARSRYVRLADRVSRFYAPMAHVTAFATFLFWLARGASTHDAIITAIAVLIVTCPCALALAAAAAGATIS